MRLKPVTQVALVPDDDALYDKEFMYAVPEAGVHVVRNGSTTPKVGRVDRASGEGSLPSPCCERVGWPGSLPCRRCLAKRVEYAALSGLARDRGPRDRLSCVSSRASALVRPHASFEPSLRGSRCTEGAGQARPHAPAGTEKVPRRECAGDGEVPTGLLSRGLARHTESGPRSWAADRGHGATPRVAGITRPTGAAPSRVEARERVGGARSACLCGFQRRGATGRERRRATGPRGAPVPLEDDADASPLRVRARRRVAAGARRLSQRVRLRAAGVPDRRARRIAQCLARWGPPLSPETPCHEIVLDSWVIAVLAVELGPAHGRRVAWRTGLRRQRWARGRSCDRIVRRGVRLGAGVGARFGHVRHSVGRRGVGDSHGISGGCVSVGRRVVGDRHGIGRRRFGRDPREAPAGD
jgi:hypothetical protein